MFTFFRGWQRKAGVITLLMALALLGLWMRSHVVTDQLWKEPPDSDDVRFGTSGGSIYWIRQTIWWEKPRSRDGWNWIAEPYHDLVELDGFRCTERHWICGAEIVVARPEKIAIDGSGLLRIGYWRCSLLWLVLPLTMVSAYLLIRKPRKRILGDQLPIS